MGELQQTLGRNVRAYRTARGWTQEVLAEVVGVHRTYLSSIEHGRRNVRLGTVEQIADGFGVPALDLLTE